ERRSGVAATLLLVDGADDPVSLFERCPNLFGFFAVRNLDLFFPLTKEARVECGRLVGGEVSIDRPVLFFLERFDFAFALDDQAESNGLHTSGRKATAHFVPQKRRDLISHQTIEDAASLLRIDQILINRPGMLEGGLYGALGNLVESHALNARRSFGLAFLCFFGFLLFGTVFVEF